jgi:hypothetical protein
MEQSGPGKFHKKATDAFVVSVVIGIWLVGLLIVEWRCQHCKNDVLLLAAGVDP